MDGGSGMMESIGTASDLPCTQDSSHDMKHFLGSGIPT